MTAKTVNNPFLISIKCFMKNEESLHVQGFLVFV